MGWQEFILNEDITLVANNVVAERYGIYGTSVNVTDKCSCFIARDDNEKFLIVTGGTAFCEFEGSEVNVSGQIVKKCPLSNHNSTIIRSIFSYANPTSVGDRAASIGLGDRLGLASPGHVKLIKDRDVFPVLAQQSIRELNLTERTYQDVLAAAVWAVFQEGYKDGFGADGDHLKSVDEVKMALDCGFTMITLDCSEYIDNDIESMESSEVSLIYKRIGESEIEYWESGYLDKTFKLGRGISLDITRGDFIKVVLTYRKALGFAEKVNNEILKDLKNEVDFEISIDETLTATSVTAHYIIASEFRRRGIKIKNMAPRFCGEFQKGIDFKGSIDAFKKDFRIHCAIAKKFGYRISVHSGSDKFSIFPIVGEGTEGRFHIKTAGTNWLEAMRVIAIENPVLFRRMYNHTLRRLPNAKKFYHIFTEPDGIPDIDRFNDKELTSLLDIEESRQALHITYGYLLCDKDETGRYIFRKEFFCTLHNFESTYYEFLGKHIGRHLDCLSI